MRSRVWKCSAGAAALLVTLAVTLGPAPGASAAQRTVLAEMFGGSG